MQDGCSIESRGGSSIQQLINHTFPRHAHKHGQIQHQQFIQLFHQLVILLQCLAEAKTRVNDN